MPPLQLAPPSVLLNINLSSKTHRRAIELNPSRPESHYHFVMFFLMPLGRVEEALHQVRIAEKIDPLSPNVQAKVAYVLISAGRYDDAADHCQKLPPDFPDRSVGMARALMGQGKIDQAIQILAEAGDRSSAYGYLGYAYGRAGRREEAEKIAASASTPWQRALTFAGLGDKDRVFGAADQMVALGPVRIGRDVINLPEFALLRGDPRVKALRKKVGLPE